MSHLARAATAGALFAVTLAAGAAAATYDQYACRRPDGGPAPADGFAGRRAGGPGVAVVDQCAAGGSLDAVVSGGGTAVWHYAPPPGTSIAGVTVRRRVVIPVGSGARYLLAGSDDRCDADASCGDGIYDLGVPAGALDFRLACPGAGCGAGGRFSVEAVRIRLTDDDPPRLLAPPGGGLFGGGVLSGNGVATYSATDVGGGVFRAALVVDGAEQERRPVDGARPGCRIPFTRAAPCPPAASGRLRLDTRRLADGEHRVALVVYDATGVNRAVYGPVAVRVANAAGGAGRHGARPPRPPAQLVLIANRSRLRNGENLTLVARLAAAPGGAAAGHVAFQVLIAGRWRTFARRALGSDGVVSLHHRFHATFRRLRYRFRAVVAGGHAAAYAPGHSGVVDVVVAG